MQGAPQPVLAAPDSLVPTPSLCRRGLALVKLGGSLLTDKEGDAQARREVITRLAQEAAEARQAGAPAFVLGHGSGSFGHVAARRAGLGRDAVSAGDAARLLGACETQRQAARLHGLLLDALHAAGCPAFSLPPSAASIAEDGALVEIAIEPVRLALDLGLVPVVCGDVVLDRRLGATVCSTETVLRALAARWTDDDRPVTRALWLGDTDGIYDAEGTTIEVLDEDRVEAVLDMVGSARGTDVTGGMRHRLAQVRALAARGVTSWIGNGLTPGHLRRALLGKTVPGTVFRAASPR